MRRVAPCRGFFPGAVLEDSAAPPLLGGAERCAARGGPSFVVQLHVNFSGR